MVLDLLREMIQILSKIEPDVTNFDLALARQERDISVIFDRN